MKIYPLIFLTLLLLPGCYKATPEVTSLPEAYSKFMTICKDEHGLDVQIKPIGKTVYIYLPIDHAILEFKSKPFVDWQDPAAEPEEKEVLNFLSSEYKQNNIRVDYSISPQKIFPKEETGYTYTYTEEFQEKQRNIVTAFYRAFGDLSSAPGDSHAPDFVALIISDVKKGVEVHTTLSFLDLHRTMMGELPADEYQKRVLYEVRGSPDALDDWDGNHIDIVEIFWPEFLARQIKNRIQYEYVRLKPTAPTHEEIMKIIAQTTSYYDFTDYGAIYLHDLETNVKYQFDQKQLKTFAP